MNSKFFDLKKEKQDRIINAALKIFALRGYRHASTDEIVREAEISKGLLFHYFDSKPGLYAFLCDYSVRFAALELRAGIDPMTADLFDLFRQIEAARMHTMKAYPYIQLFLLGLTKEQDEEARAAAGERPGIWIQACENWYRQVDETIYPYGTDIPRIRRMLQFTADSLLTEHLGKEEFVPELLYEEFCTYLKMMKKIVLK